MSAIKIKKDQSVHFKGETSNTEDDSTVNLPVYATEDQEETDRRSAEARETEGRRSPSIKSFSLELDGQQNPFNNVKTAGHTQEKPAVKFQVTPVNLVNEKKNHHTGENGEQDFNSTRLENGTDSSQNKSAKNGHQDKVKPGPSPNGKCRVNIGLSDNQNGNTKRRGNYQAIDDDVDEQLALNVDGRHPRRKKCLKHIVSMVQMLTVFCTFGMVLKLVIVSNIPPDSPDISIEQEPPETNTTEGNFLILLQDLCGKCPNLENPEVCADMKAVMAFGIENCKFRSVQRKQYGHSPFHKDTLSPWIPPDCSVPVIGIPTCTTKDGNVTVLESRRHPKCTYELQYRCRSSGWKKKKIYRHDMYFRNVTIAYKICEVLCRIINHY